MHETTSVAAEPFSELVRVRPGDLSKTREHKRTILLQREDEWEEIYLYR